VADNRIAELSEMNEIKLAEMIKEIEQSGDVLDIKITGFDETELNKLLQQVAQEIGTQVPDNIDDIPDMPDDPQQLMTQPGDLWILGEHRLLCGDATKLEHARKLMNGQLAHMVNIDPPYGVAYNAASGKFDIIKNDDKQQDELINTLLLPIFQVGHAITVPTAGFYIWHAWATHQDFDYAIAAAGLLERQCIIWVKPNLAMGHNDYQWAHEPCYYCNKAGETPSFYGDRAQASVWRLSYRTAAASAMVLGTGIVVLDGKGGKLFIAAKPPKNKKARTIRLNEGQELFIYQEDALQDIWEISRDTNKAFHPTQKPVELAIRAIENSSQPGQIVWDGCLGSGSTLIGAEVTGRKCYGTEITQYYTDMIVKRWEAATGRQAQRQENYLGLSEADREAWRKAYAVNPREEKEAQE
jgi:DNA modification methylase